MIHFQFSKVYQSFPPPQKIYSASKTLFDESSYEIAENDVDELFYSKNSWTSHDPRIGEYCFCEALKVDLAESEAKRQKISLREARISFQALCLYFAYYLRIWDVLLNCMRN